MIRILLVDDHPSVGEGAKKMIENDPEMKVTVLLSAVEALELARLEMFDVMLFDLNMPGINGLELMKRMMEMNPNSCILIYTGLEVGPYFNILVESGASGFIDKAASRDQLIRAIRCAVCGESIVPIQMFRQLRRKEIHFSRICENKSVVKVSINEREQEILQELACGKSNKEIAGKLFVSQRTIEYNLTRIFAKLNVRSRSEAIAEAERLGLITYYR